MEIVVSRHTLEVQYEKPVEMLWRHFRREVTHGELFENMDALLKAAQDFFDRHNLIPNRVLSIIGAHPA